MFWWVCVMNGCMLLAQFSTQEATGDKINECKNAMKKLSDLGGSGGSKRRCVVSPEGYDGCQPAVVECVALMCIWGTLYSNYTVFNDDISQTHIIVSLQVRNSTILQFYYKLAALQLCDMVYYTMSGWWLGHMGVYIYIYICMFTKFLSL
jgi:hypothetical protein